MGPRGRDGLGTGWRIMPNTKSAWKRMRTAEKARMRNKAMRTRIKRLRRAFLEACGSGDPATVQEAFRLYSSVLDKAAKKRVITRNTATRRKSRAALRVRKVTAA